jgi:hypothetical protein
MVIWGANEKQTVLIEKVVLRLVMVKFYYDFRFDQKLIAGN